MGHRIDDISTKIKRNTDVIKRIRNSLPKEHLEMLYKTIVEPHFRYCNTVCGHYGDTLLNRPQALQNRAARVISFNKYDNTDHERLLKNVNWLSVRQLIMSDTAVLVYKSRNEQVSIRTSVMFQTFEVDHRVNTGLAASGGYALPRCARNFGQRSITYQGMKLWNTLPNEIKEAQSVEVFEQKMKNYLFEIF